MLQLPFRVTNHSNWTSIKYLGVAINTSKVHINNMYIKNTFVHFAILLIRQILGAVPLPVTSPFAVEKLSLRLRSRLGFFHLRSNLFAVILEVPLSSFAPFIETSGLVNHQHLMFFLISTFVDLSITKSLGIISVILAYYSSSWSSSSLVIVTRELCQSLYYLED